MNPTAAIAAADWSVFISGFYKLHARIFSRTNPIFIRYINVLEVCLLVNKWGQQMGSTLAKGFSRLPSRKRRLFRRAVHADIPGDLQLNRMAGVLSFDKNLRAQAGASQNS
jgi:hypothetical protein